MRRQQGDCLQLLRAPVIAGAANNPLVTTAHADDLWRRGCLHAPYYAINAGGIIDVSYEYNGGYGGAGASTRGRYWRNTAADLSEGQRARPQYHTYCG